MITIFVIDRNSQSIITLKNDVHPVTRQEFHDSQTYYQATLLRLSEVSLISETIMRRLTPLTKF